MTSRVGPRVRHCRGMRSFPRGVPRKFKRRDHPTLLSRGQNVCKSRVFSFFFFFIALPIIISRRPRVDLPNDLPPDVRSNALLQQRISFEIRGGGEGGISIDAPRRSGTGNADPIANPSKSVVRARSFRSKNFCPGSGGYRDEIALVGHFVVYETLSTTTDSLLNFCYKCWRKSWRIERNKNS